MLLRRRANESPASNTTDNLQVIKVVTAAMHVGLTRCGIAVKTTERWEACEWSPKKINLRKDHAFSSGIIAVAAKSERRESEPCDCIDTNSEKISDV